MFSSDFVGFHKVDAPVFFTYLQSVRTISKLQQSSHYESGFKTGRRRTKGILGLCVKILFIPPQYFRHHSTNSDWLKCHYWRHWCRADVIGVA